MRMGNLVKCKFLFWELNAASISWCLHFKTQKGDQHENILVLQNSCSGTGILGVLESDQFEDGMHAGHNFLKWSNIDRAVARPISALLYSFSSKNMETPGLSVVSDHVYLGCLSHRYLW